MPPNGETDVLDADRVAAVLNCIDGDEVAGFLRSLIQYETVNPPGDVADAAEFCRAKLAREGFDAAIVGPSAEHRNVVATLRGAGNGPHLLFNAHLDVVPIGDVSAWTHPPFAGVIEERRMFGRGAADDKASVAAQVMAAVAIARSGLPLQGTLTITAVADEETGGDHGAGYLVDEHLESADFVIVGEPTNGIICIGERGRVVLELTVHGKTGHAAVPASGVNAVELMGRIMSDLVTRLWPEVHARAHPVLPPSTATISLVNGGVKINVIPDRCTIAIDRRIVPGESVEGTVREIQDVAERILEGVAGASVTVSTSVGRPARMTDVDSPVALAITSAVRALGREPRLGGFFAGSDAKHFARRNWPTLIVGPGNPAVAHTPDEWVDLDDVMYATRLYALTALYLLR